MAAQIVADITSLVRSQIGDAQTTALATSLHAMMELRASDLRSEAR